MWTKKVHIFYLIMIDNIVKICYNKTIKRKGEINMTYKQFKNAYYDLVDAGQDNDKNIEELLNKAEATNIEITDNKILFNFENEKYIIDKKLNIFAKRS